MRGREQRNWIDTLLVGLASACAVYSGGQAVGSDIVSIFALSLVVVGTLFSSFVAWRFQGSRLIRIDGFLFVAFGIGAFLGSRYLNLIFEEDTFPRELLPSSWLLWLLMFGSFVLWRDTTLLFQAIPALALFGFVGCYDTFRPVVVFFFVYLVCVATLFARAHARDMAERAELSGYFGNDVAAIKAGRGITVALRKGPWRWVAGPEWALGSALAIVFLSLLGAPAIRQGVKPISGIARVVGPRTRPNQQGPVTSGNPTVAQDSTRIARGPVRLRNTPAFDISGAEGLYFRTGGFDAYDRGGWRKDWVWRDVEGEVVQPRPSEVQRANSRRVRLREASLPVGRRTLLMGEYRLPEGEVYRGNPRNIGRADGKSASDRIGRLMRVSSRSETVAIPVPGEFLKFGDPFPYASVDPGESVSLNRARQYDELPVYFSPYLEVRAQAKTGTLSPTAGTPRLSDPALSTQGTPPHVATFARNAAGTGTDGERAERLRAAIAARISYNINASAAPPEIDPVERALFETKEGYCDVFASAMVLGAREIGIPARYAVGYLADVRNVSREGTLTLLDSDAHAWAELYFEGLGWVPFDATAGARVVRGGGRRDGDDTQPWYRAAWIPTAINVGIGSLVLGGAVLLLWPRRRDARASLRARDETVDRFVRSLARRTRRDRRLDESLVVYVAGLGPVLGEVSEPARTLADDLERALYGPEEPDETTNAELARRVHSLRRSLKSVPRPK